MNRAKGMVIISLLIICLLSFNACSLLAVGSELNETAAAAVTDAAETAAVDDLPAYPVESADTTDENTHEPPAQSTDAPQNTAAGESEKGITGGENIPIQSIDSLRLLPIWKIALIGLGLIAAAAVLLFYLAVWENMQEAAKTVDSLKKELEALKQKKPEGDQTAHLQWERMSAEISKNGRALVERGESVYLLIPTQESNYLRLLVEEQGGDYVLKFKKKEPVVIHVEIVASGTHSRGLAPTDKKSDLIVQLNDTNSFTGQLIFEAESITERYINQRNLGFFFDFQNIPPFPTPCGIRMEKPAVVTRDESGFSLKQKGIVSGVPH